MRRIRVRLKDRSYDILIGRGLLKKSGELIRSLRSEKDAVCITNARLLRLYRKTLQSSLTKSGMTVRFERVPDSEGAKSVRIAASLIKEISIYDKRKRLFIINFGGGVVGDLGGFVAAVYKRGTPYVQIPTTLLAQVDSAIGGKVAIDLPAAKNLVGAFYQPRLVISDIDLIGSLPARQIRNGLAEIVKYGVIKDRKLFTFLERNYRKILEYDENALTHIVSASSRIKAALVEKDELDRTGSRAILNYGHTIGHAIEAASGYSNKYNHGEAVAIGMIIASKISLRLGLIGSEEARRIRNLIVKLGLPTNARGLHYKDVYEAHLHDKKFIHGENRFVLPVRIGKVRLVSNVPEAIIRRVLREELL